MTDNLRSKVIHLAHSKPDLREALLPLLKTAGASYLDFEGLLKQSGWVLDRQHSMASHDNDVYKKRVNGVWVIAIVYTSLWSGQATLAPSSTPKGISSEAFDQYLKEGLVRLDYQTSSTEIERAAKGVAAKYKEFSGPRKKKDPEKFEWDGKTGAEAIKAWQAKIEQTLLDILGVTKTVYDYSGKPRVTHPSSDTESLVHNLLDNYSLEPGGSMLPNRRDVSRAIRAILERMAKQRKILKETGGPTLEWSMDF